MRSNRAEQDGLETLRFAASFFLSEAACDDIRSVSDESRPVGGEYRKAKLATPLLRIGKRYMGSAILLGGLFKGADVLWRKRFAWLAFPWIAMLLVAAVLLITYREPPGAYRRSGPGARNFRFSPPIENG